MTGKHHKLVPIEERFWSKVKADPSGCLLWTASIGWGGYGQFWDQVKVIPAHRWLYELKKGPVPEGLQLDHLCRVRNCVNPDHLEAVTIKENVLRGVGPSAKAARVTHCPQGHPYNLINTAFDSKGYRNCRICIKLHRVERWKELKASRTVWKNRGENHYSSKLTLTQVAEIREMYSTGNYTHRELAKMFGCSHNNIGDIIHHKIWK